MGDSCRQGPENPCRWWNRGRPGLASLEGAPGHPTQHPNLGGGPSSQHLPRRVCDKASHGLQLDPDTGVPWAETGRGLTGAGGEGTVNQIPPWSRHAAPWHCSTGFAGQPTATHCN